MSQVFKVRILRLALLIAIISPAVRAQVSTADLYGLMRDPSANAVPETQMRVQNLDTGLARTAVTGEDGSYSFLGLRPGRYSVYAEATGFRPVLVKEVALTVGQRAELSFRLEVNPVMEAIEILSKTQLLLEARRTSVATTIVERLIKDLPSRGARDAFNFALLDSAASRENQASLPPIPATGLNIEAQPTRANMVNIDGVDAIDNTINGVRITIPQDAVPQFQILKSGHNAEHGRSSAAVINIVSRQGGVRTHGDLFGLLRSRHVSASNPFAGEPDPGDTNTQAGFTLGGSLRRTFFFIGFDTTQENSIGISTIVRDNFGFVEIQNSVGSGSLLITREQAQFIRGAPVSLGALYSAVADRAARTALFGNSPGGPRTFGLIPNLLPSSFRGLTTEAGNYKTTQDSYVHSSRLDHTFGTHGLFVRIGSSSSDTLGRASNSQIRRTQTLELTSSS